MKKVIVTMLDFKEMQRMRSRINMARLEDLKLYNGDKRIRVTKKQISEWRFTGLSNVDFIEFIVLGSGWKNY